MLLYSLDCVREASAFLAVVPALAFSVAPEALKVDCSWYRAAGLTFLCEEPPPVPDGVYGARVDDSRRTSTLNLRSLFSYRGPDGLTPIHIMLGAVRIYPALIYRI